VFAGNSKIPVKGYGDVDIRTEGPNGSHTIRLRDVAYCQGFACNLVSLRQLRRKGYWWDNKPPNNFVRQSDNSIVCELLDLHDQFVMEHIPEDISPSAFFVRRNKFNSWTKRAPNSTDEHTWHLRLGHPGPEALNHLVNQSQGVRIKGAITTIDCNDCGCAKAKRQIRREPRDRPEKAGTHLAIDFHDFEQSSNGYTSVMLITDRFSGYIWDFYLQNRQARTITDALRWLFSILERQYQIKPEVIECDNELENSHEIKKFITIENAMRLEPSAPNTQSQNGGAERSGGVIKEKARAMRGGAKLPHFLWTEIVRTAVYLYNRTPKYLYNWKSPYERFFTFLSYRDGIVVSERKPQQAHLRVFGCKAFAMTAEAQLKKNRRQRLNPKAWIGFLVGYNSTNIYRIWNPATNRVIAVRDVVFNEKHTFNGDIQTIKDDLLHISSEELETMLRRVEISQGSDTMLSYSTQNEDDDLCVMGDGLDEAGLSYDESIGDTITQVDNNDENLVDPAYGSGATNSSGAEGGSIHYRLDPPGVKEYFSPYLTPDRTPSPPAALLAATIRNSADEEEVHDQDLRTVEEMSTPHSIDPKFECWRTVFNAGRLVSELGTINGEKVRKAHFVRAMKLPSSRPDRKIIENNVKPKEAMRSYISPEKAVQLLDPEKVKQLRTAGKLCKLRQRDLPPPPKTHKDLRTHAFGVEFREAEKAHLKSHQESRTWETVRRTVAAGKQIIDCMWVYVYKFDKHGRLAKCKARLVIRGDQQDKTGQNTYASTLAGRSFRSLMAIAARFNLELIQYDVANAFVNAEVQEEIYMRMPQGYRTPDILLRLKKALYGLRQAPLLWQKHFTETLRRIGFERVPHEPCCYLKNGVIVFFYVDDIVIAYEKHKKSYADQAVESLKRTYTLTGGGNLQWFLGIEVVRDREQQLIWLSQGSYIDKISKLVDCAGSIPSTPMRNKELLPYEGKASYSSINRYQRKIGSILYAAVNTRLDIAFAASRLARFNTNPSEEHHAEADRVIRYLYGTRTLALQLGGADTFEVASDASFADNTLDRTSSQAYVMKLFGGTIGRANKQDTVTTSTTEAELLFLAQAAKESLFVTRLVKDMGVTLDDSQITIQCDNKQTIRLVNADIASLQTKLRHVDIHNHWLRQEAARKRIKVVYTPSNDMIADGLTKSLHAQQHQRFVRQVGLVDIRQRLEDRKPEELPLEFLDQLEDSLDGGEIDLELT
jgi:Reverse transcriptase (RNA-dependent DNA polymerase)